MTGELVTLDPTIIPTHGCARRRAKAVARRRHVHAIENNLLVAAGHLPRHGAALSVCPCGRVSWLEEGATAEDHEAFTQDNDDHAAYCEGWDQ